MKDWIKAVILLVVLFVGYTAYQGGWLQQPACGAGFYRDSVGNCVQISVPPPGPGPVATTQAAGVSLQLFFVGVQDAWSGDDLQDDTSADVNIDIFDPTDHSRVIETIDYDASTDNGEPSAGYFAQGQRLLIHVAADHDPTNGAEYYDEWYMLTVGGALTILRPPNDIGTSTGTVQISEYAYGTVVQGVTSSGGTYWVVSPALKVYGRIAADGVDFNMVEPDGSLSTSSTSDGDTAVTFAAQGSQSTSYDAATGTKQFSFYLTAVMSNLNLVYGRPMIVLNSNPPYDFAVKYTAIWVAWNSTALTRETTTGVGFSPVTTQPTGWWVVWKTLPTIGNGLGGQGISAIYSSRSTLGYERWEIKMDTTNIADATEIAMATYIGDLQFPASVAVGSADGAPSAYGGASQIGPDTTLGIEYATATTGINAGSNAPSTSTQVYASIDSG